MQSFTDAEARILNAQAWIPTKGEGTVSLTYQNYDVAGHYDARGRKNNNGGTQSHVAVAEVDYGITDTIGLTVNLPFIASKYTGPPIYFVGGIETHPGPLDDGTYHGAFQDVRVEVRRLFWAGPIPVAPFIGASFPTHDYETVGEAVPGRHRRDLQIGANVGINLDRLLSGRVRPRALRIRDRPADRGIRVHSQQCRRRGRLPNSVTLRAPRACRLGRSATKARRFRN